MFMLTNCYCSTIKTCSFEIQDQNFIDSKCLIDTNVNSKWFVTSSYKTQIVPSFRGKFAMLEEPFESALKTTQFSSEPYGCVSFWYYSPAEGNTIEVSINGNRNAKHVHTLKNNEYWTLFETGYASNGTKNEITITAKVLQQFVSLDEIEINEEPCKKISQECRFAFDSCSLHSSSVKKWSISGDKKLSKNSFISVKFDDVPFTTDLVSTLYPPNEIGKACINFKYLFNGLGLSDNPNFEVRVMNVIEGKTRILWSKTAASGNVSDFERSLLSVSGLTSQWRIIFSVNSAATKSGLFALTDITIKPYSCSDDLNCNFESGTCQWDIYGDDQSNIWKRKIPQSSTEYNWTSLGLPTKDVTFNSTNGSFLFTDYMLNNNSITKIKSQNTSRPFTEGCLSFWLFTNCSLHVDSQLSVSFHENDQKLLEAVPRQVDGKVWNQIMYKLIFERDMFGHFEIDLIRTDVLLAIDDIVFDYNECRQTSPQEDSPDIASVTERSILNCDFDGGNSCNYIIPEPFEGSHFNWMFTDDYPGPYHDSSGIHHSFLVSSYVNGVPAAPRTFTELWSPMVTASAYCYISFNISFQGNYHLSVVNQGIDPYEIWYDEQSQTNFVDWRHVDMTISSQNLPFRINFVSRRTDGFVAIDRLQLGKCFSVINSPKRDGLCTFEPPTHQLCLEHWVSPNISSARNVFRDGPTRDADLSREGNFALLRGSHITSYPFVAKKSCLIRFFFMTFNESYEVYLNDGESGETLGILENNLGNSKFDVFSWVADSDKNFNYVTLSLEPKSNKEYSYAAIDNTFFSSECQFSRSEPASPTNTKGMTIHYYFDRRIRSIS